MGFSKKLAELLRKRFDEPEQQTEIDQEIETNFGRDATVIITDLSRSTAITREKGIIHFLSLIQRFRDLVSPVLKRHDGLVAKWEGDSSFLVFKNSVSALQFALDIRETCDSYNSTSSEEQKIHLSQGIASGHVILTKIDVFGDPVNTASKLGEDTAGPREIFLSEGVFAETKTLFQEQVFEKKSIAISGMVLTYFSV